MTPRDTETRVVSLYLLIPQQKDLKPRQQRDLRKNQKHRQRNGPRKNPYLLHPQFWPAALGIIRLALEMISVMQVESIVNHSARECGWTVGQKIPAKTAYHKTQYVFNRRAIVVLRFRAWRSMET